MDQIISKLSEIEVASARIVDSAATDTKKLDDQLKQRIAAYDRAEDQKMTDTLSQLREQLARDMEENLKDLRQHTETAIETITQIFEKQHEKLADKILNDLIRM